MILSVIWDVDGTLFDTYPAISRAFQSAMKDLGYDAPYDWVAKLAQISLGHCARTLAADYGLDENEIGRRFDLHYDQVKPEDQPPFPGVVQICEYIRSLGGKNVIVTHRGRASTLELLETHGMTHLFSGWITRDDGFARKPDPDAFEAAIKRFDLPCESTITVGDREIDIKAGQGAGIYSCYYGENPSAAEFCFRDFAELDAFIREENAKTGLKDQ